jgi:hypothetical protein
MGDSTPDPGGTIPPGSNAQTPMEILISAVESSMDTDVSVSNTTETKLKRKLLSVVCKNCNKRKRKSGRKIGQNDCKCEDNLQHNLSEESNYVTSSPVPVPVPVVGVETPTIPGPTLNSDVNDSLSTRVPVGRARYQDTDIAPFVVHVQKEASTEGTTLHPITFGRFMQRNNIQGIEDGSIKRVGRNRISLAFKTHSDANKFLSNQNLEKERYKVFIPTFNITRMGVIKGVPTDLSDDEVQAAIKVPIGCGSVIKIRRIKRKITVNNISQFIDTGTIIITFDGQILPTRVYMWYTSLPVDLYIYPTVQCYNCCRFGHVKNQCRSLPKCYKCGQGHSGDNCNVEEDDYWCCLCKGRHQATSKSCLEFSRQKNIKETMSKSCISYMEAIKMHPPVSKGSYAEALLSTPTPSSSPHTLNNTYNTNSPSTSNNRTHSYKKTVFLKPRTPSRPSKGFDHLAHSEIIREPVLQKGKPVYENNSNNDDNMNTSDIIKFLIQLLSQPKIVSPSNVAAVINAIYQFQNINNGSKVLSSAVELSQLNQ